MKFGLQYHELILAKWAAHYVDYNGLRARIRGKATHDDGAFTEALWLLIVQIKAFESFIQRKLASLRNIENQYCIRFGLPANPRGWCLRAKSCESEISFFQEFYGDLLLELRDLQSFNTVNETAASRLFDKFTASCPTQSKKLERAKEEWLVRQYAANKASHDERLKVFGFICALRQERGDQRPAWTSLGVQAMRQYKLPREFHRFEIYEFCIKDDASMIEAAIRKCSDPDFDLGTTVSNFIGDLVILAMLLASDNTTRMLLTLVKQRKLAIEIHHVSVILALWRRRGQGNEFSRPLAETLCDTATISSLFPGPFKLEKPLIHYAVQYGYVELYEEFARKASETGSHFLEALLYVDADGKTPLHVAILARNTAIFLDMLKAVVSNNSNMKSPSALATLLGELLLLAVRMNNNDIVEIILRQDVDLQATSFASEHVLYIASQSGSLVLVRSIVHYMRKVGQHLNEKTSGSGWTSLMVACANGHQDIVSYLLAAGADPSQKDSRGWTAQEHAAFRGHLVLSELPALGAVSDALEGPARCDQPAEKRALKPLCPGKKAIILNLGSVQGGHERPALRLPAGDTENSHGPKKPVTLMLELSMHKQESQWIPALLLHDYTNEPFFYVVDEDEPAQITVRLYRWNSPVSKLLLGGGTVVLGQDDEKFGPRRESMLREVTIFLMKKDAMEPAGTVLLSYVVATSFAGLQSPASSIYRRQANTPPRLVGHRGLGQNTASQSNLQLGENTAMSFLSAAKLGASFIEFDLQLTRDLEAVVFHDFSLSELGTDVPIHDVTLAQYKHASCLQSPQEALSAILTGDVKGLHGPRQRQRTFSNGEESMLRSLQLKERLLYTVDFQNKGFKPNTRGHSIQDTLATLDELLVKLPENIGFNIEMKYPRLHEAIEAGVAPVTIDINTFVDTALEKLQRLSGQRPIILSSFTPEICILLSLKQKAYPVMFITNAGKVPMTDKELRAASLQMGVQFARRWNLDGIVLACETFLHCPRFIKFVQNAGLVCASYGLLNNDAVNSRLQADAGIDIIIADKVKLIADELNKDITR